MPNSDEPISVVEDLDPEPASGRGGRLGWEVALGLVLLLGVIGFAGWQWLRQGQQQDEYAAGIEAMESLHWEAAQGYFASASGYRDADKEAQAAATKIAQRDSQYNIAIENENAGNWAACLKSIQQVVDIQPGYKDSARIEEQASKQVYRDAMSGTIASRPDANPPGLYYYGESGWTWLPRSDGFSRVRGQSAGDWIAYDIPGERRRPGLPGPSPTPISGVVGSSDLEGRRFAAIRWSNLSDLRYIAFDPSQYNIELVGSEGVWAVGYNIGVSFYNPPVRDRLLGTEHGGILAYYAYGSWDTQAITIALSTVNNAAVMALDPNSNRYLMADWVHASPEGDAEPETVTNLYLGSMDGSKRLLYTLDGGSFISAQFSPDGHYALLATYEPVVQAVEKQAILLFDLSGMEPTRILGQLTAQVDASPDTDPQITSWIKSAFVRDGPFSGKVVITEYDGNQNRLQVFDPQGGGGQEPLVDLPVPTDQEIIWTLHPGNSEISLLSGEEVVGYGYQLVEVPLWFVKLSLDNHSAVTRLRTLVNNYVEHARLVGGVLAYSTYEYGQNGRDTRSVFSFPIDRFGAIGENAWTMFTQMDTASGNDIFSFGDYSLGPTLLIYVSDDNLHARVYDGSVDVVLEHGVSYLYDTSAHHLDRGRLK